MQLGLLRLGGPARPTLTFKVLGSCANATVDWDHSVCPEAFSSHRMWTSTQTPVLASPCNPLDSLVPLSRCSLTLVQPLYPQQYNRDNTTKCIYSQTCCGLNGEMDVRFWHSARHKVSPQLRGTLVFLWQSILHRYVHNMHVQASSILPDLITPIISHSLL